MPYLASRSGIFFLRLHVPNSLQPLLGQAEIFLSLKTSNRQEARILALGLSAELLASFQELKKMTRTPEEENERLKQAHSFLDGIYKKKKEEDQPESKIKKFELDELSNGRPYIKKAEPGLDMENANAALARAEAAADKAAIAQPKTVVGTDTAKLFSNMAGIKLKSLVSAVKEYIDELKNKKMKSVRHVENGLKHFVDWITKQHPSIQVHRVNNDHLKEYREILRNTKSHKKPFKPLHEHTVLKRLQFIETFFRFCQDQKYFPDGERSLPTFGIKPDKPDYETSETSYEPFTFPELKKIYSAKTYAPNKKSPHQYWAPLLGLFTGARKSELINLHPDSINNHNPDKVWTISFVVKPKNKNSKRIVPLHQTLIDLGFLDYLDDVRSVFPEAQTIFPYTNDMDKAFGRGFASHLDRLKIQSPRKVFHSYRKNVAERLKMAGVVGYDYQEHFTGHLKYSLHQNIYSGKAKPLKYYSNLINPNLTFDIDLNHLKYKKSMFTEKLLEEKKKQDREKKFSKQ